MAENTAMTVRNGEGKVEGGPFAFFHNFLQNFPLFKKESKSKDAVVTVVKISEEEGTIEKGESARVPVTRTDFPVLKLEPEVSEKETSSGNMWQIYAIGGFLLVTWAVAKWKERKTNKPGPGDGSEEPTIKPGTEDE